MTMIQDALERAGTFTHSVCGGCPWVIEGMAFGTSCRKHHIEWDKTETGVTVMALARDPGGTTPEHTGTLCGFCNSQNPTDATAKNSFNLMKAAIIGDWGISNGDMQKLCAKWYVTNVVKHGVPTKGNFSRQEVRQMKHQLEVARFKCAEILKEEINILKPRLIKACGRDALESLRQLRIMRTNGWNFREYVERSPHRIDNFYPDGSPLYVFCLYHTAGKVTNMTLSRFYNKRMLDDIERLTGNHPNPAAVEEFMRFYERQNENVRKGMIVHLRYWLRLGELIRDI